MRITSIEIRKIKNAGTIKAVASIVLDDAICINRIEIVERRDGMFISFPIRRNREGRIFNIAHPINSEIREKIQKAIIQEYKEKCSEG